MTVTLENGAVRTVERNLGVVRTPIYFNASDSGDTQPNGHTVMAEMKPAEAAPRKDDIKEEMAANNMSGRMMCKTSLYLNDLRQAADKLGCRSL